MSTAFVAIAALTLVACDGPGGDAPPAPTAAATAAPTSAAAATPAATPTPRPEPTPQPPLEELYNLRPYRPQVQGSPQIGGPITRIPPPDLAAANAEGPLWQGEFAYEGPYPAAFDGVEGTSEPVCVEIGSRQRVRSNDWVLDVSAWQAPDYVFELFPANVDELRPGPGAERRLMIRATELASEPATYVHERMSWPAEGEAGDVSYRPTVALPRAGTWLVAVTAGRQWGCFIVDVAPPPEQYRTPTTVAEVEDMGAEYPSEPAPADLTSSFARERGPGATDQSGYTTGGTADRECVDVEGIHDARSGDWVMRPAGPYAGGWRPSFPGSKTLCVPLHQPDDRKTAAHELRLTATLLDDPRHVYVYEEPLNVVTLDADTELPNQVSFVTSLAIPRAGTWALVATGGPNWGCFLLTLGG